MQQALRQMSHVAASAFSVQHHNTVCSAGGKIVYCAEVQSNTPQSSCIHNNTSPMLVAVMLMTAC